MKQFIFTISAFLIFFSHSPLMAFELPESLQIHGFLSQGYLLSNDNNFFSDDSSEDGTFKFSYAGINANLTLHEDWRIGGQFFYRTLGDYNEDNISIDWALIAYEPYDFLGIKVGKVKMPIGLHNETRDTDFLLPMLFLPQSIYDESRRDIFLAYIGGGIYGNLNAGELGDFDYHLFAGKTDFPSDSVTQASLENTIQSIITKNNALPLSKRNPKIPSTFWSVDRESDHVYGGALFFNSEVISGLRLGFTFLHSKPDIYVNNSSDPIGDTVIHGKSVISAEYRWEDFIFTSEYSETERTTTFFDRVFFDETNQAWYVMVNYAPFAKWTFSVLYDEYYLMKDDRDGSTRPQIPAESVWRKDIALGAKWEINKSWVAKMEYHWLDGTAMELVTFNPSGADRYWHYGTASISFVF